MNLSVIHAPEDIAFARDLSARVAPFATVKLFDIDELAAMLPASRWQLGPAVGVPLFVVSGAVLAKGERRQALIAGNPVLGSPRFRSYYLCRGIEPAAVVADDLRPLTDEVMLIAESRAGEVIEDLRQYARSPELAPPGCGSLWPWLGRTLLLLLLMVYPLVAHALRLVFLAAFLAGPALVLSIWFESIARYRTWLVALCGFGWGTALTAIETLDLWPWFGRAFRLRRDDPRIGEVLRTYRKSRLSAIWMQLVGVLLFVAPVLAMRRTVGEGAALAFAMGLVAGIAREIAGRWAAREEFVLAAEQHGLQPAAMSQRDRTTARYDVVPMPWAFSGLAEEERALFTPEEAETVRRWLTLNALGSSPAFHRPFVTKPDYVFISYVWADDTAVHAAKALADTLEQLGIPHFLDRRHIGNGFAGWRANLARELESATHVFLVVSPLFANGRIVQREIHTLIQRWHVEQLPAILCVADDDVAGALLRHPAAPLELRFMLACCARLTQSDIRNPDLVRRVIVQRRRQGRVRDWVALLRPRRTEAALLDQMIW